MRAVHGNIGGHMQHPRILWTLLIRIVVRYIIHLAWAVLRFLQWHHAQKEKVATGYLIPIA
jgi:hypothetical protein